ncbi:MAG: oxidoreductase-like domain-containing protein [Panacagrimonas sp.]
MRYANDPKPEPPDKPLPGDCCDTGCAPCVLDAYADAMQAYRTALRQWQDRQSQAIAPASQRLVERSGPAALQHPDQHPTEEDHSERPRIR